MEDNPLVPDRSPKRLLRANGDAERKALIRSTLQYYEKAPARVDPVRDLAGAELELLMLVLGVDAQLLNKPTRNHYIATPNGRSHRQFQALERRGLVNLFPHRGDVACRVTAAGSEAVERGINAAIAARK